MMVTLPRRSWTAFALMLALATIVPAPAADTPTPTLITPAQWLQLQAPPRFAPGHTLLPLTRWGWVLPLDARKELAEHWGYALEFPGYVTQEVADKAVADPNSDGGQCLALAQQQPEVYRLGVLLNRQFPKDMPPEAYCRDAQGNFILDDRGNKVLSTEMPEAVLREAAQLSAAPLAKLHTRAPLAVILNGGEYGLGVLGFTQKFWEKDPRIVAAKGSLNWYQYLSRQKAREQGITAEAVRAACPDRLVYVYYPSGGDTHRRGPESTYQNHWGWDFKDMRQGTDMASNEYYYHDFNTGWIGNDNMLTQALGAKGYEIRYGSKNSYDWLCAGYKQPDPKVPVYWDPTAPIDNNAKAFGDLRIYQGFLKCLYTEGMLGGVAGYFSFPAGGFGAKFPPNQPPNWLVQMAILGRVHALFSYLESYLRQGDLLPGPNQHVHVPDQPAYEFPTGSPNHRVLARKMPKEPRWLITAWAADGVDGPESVEIPELGRITVECRAIGSVYRARLVNGRVILQQVDAADLGPV